MRLPPILEMVAAILNEYTTYSTFVLLRLGHDHLPTCVMIDDKSVDGTNVPFDLQEIAEKITAEKVEAFRPVKRHLFWLKSRQVIDEIPPNVVCDELRKSVYAIKFNQTEAVDKMRFSCVQLNQITLISNVQAQWTVEPTPYERLSLKLWKYEIK